MQKGLENMTYKMSYTVSTKQENLPKVDEIRGVLLSINKKTGKRHAALIRVDGVERESDVRLKVSGTVLSYVAQ